MPGAEEGFLVLVAMEQMFVSDMRFCFKARRTGGKWAAAPAKHDILAVLGCVGNPQTGLVAPLTFFRERRALIHVTHQGTSPPTSRSASLEDAAVPAIVIPARIGWETIEMVQKCAHPAPSHVAAHASTIKFWSSSERKELRRLKMQRSSLIRRRILVGVGDSNTCPTD